MDKELRNDVLSVINLVIGTDHVDLPPHGKHPQDTCGAPQCCLLWRSRASQKAHAGALIGRGRDTAVPGRGSLLRCAGLPAGPGCNDAP